MNTRDSLINDLKALRIKPTDTVMMHSSYHAIGETEGRGDGVLDALTDYLNDGLLALPAITWRVAHEGRVFDVRNTPSKVGILPELFRKRPDTVRSWHPTHSVCAYGADAKQFTGEDHMNHSPCGLRSSWHKLLERDAVILQVGCTLNNCTFMHGTDEWLDLPGRLSDPIEMTVIPPDGESFRVWSSCHVGSPSERFHRAEEAFLESGALTFGTFGSAKVYRLSATGIYETLKKLLKNDPLFFDR